MIVMSHATRLRATYCFPFHNLSFLICFSSFSLLYNAVKSTSNMHQTIHLKLLFFPIKYSETLSTPSILMERKMETKSISLFSNCLQLLTSLLLASLLFASNVHNSSAAATTTTKTSKTTYIKYLKTACNTTTRPKLCYNSLSPYISTIETNDLKLCETALTISLEVAKKTYALVKNLSRQKRLSKLEVGIIQDCKEEIGDSINELKNALQVLDSLKGSNKNVELHIADIKTWVSAAITDESSCADEFDNLKVSTALTNKIRKSISEFDGLTSNALALINKLNQ